MLAWTANLCASILFGPSPRPRGHATPEETPHRAGSCMPGTLHGVRTVEVAPLSNADEVCRKHYGRLTIGANGYARVIYCTREDASGNAEGKRHGEARVIVRRSRAGVDPDADPLKPLMRLGYTAMLGSYQTPAITEALLVGQVARCGHQPS